MECLDEWRLRLYAAGTLPAEEMISASEHVRACTACRAALAGSSHYRRAAASLSQTVLGVDECPEYEVLSAFAEEELSHEAHQTVERHVSICELCWRDVRVLEAARSRASLAPRVVVRRGQFASRRAWTVFGWQRAAALVASAVAVAAALVLVHPGPSGRAPGKKEMVRVPPRVTTPADRAGTRDTSPLSGGYPAPRVPVPRPPRSIETPEPTPAPIPTPRREFLAELTDGSVAVGTVGGKLTARADGRQLEGEIAAIVDRKLREGRVPSSVRMAMLPDTMRGGPPDTTDVKKLSPAPNGLADPRPEFRWEPVDGATAYRIEVYDLMGNPVVSAVTDAPSYQPKRRLPGGGYKWMVWVQRGAMADWTPSDANAFRILSDRESRLISAAKRDYPGSHIVLGSVYESIGLNEDASREFEALASEYPGSALAGRLLQGVKSKLQN